MLKDLFYTIFGFANQDFVRGYLVGLLTAVFIRGVVDMAFTEVTYRRLRRAEKDPSDCTGSR